MRYWLLDPAGALSNTIEWDGVAAFAIPDGYSLQLAEGDPPALSPAQLAAYKQAKLTQLARRTLALDSKGFTFTLQVGGPTTFTLEQAARANWLGLFLGATNGAITFPFAGIATVSGPSATFSSAGEVAAWYQGGLARIVAIETAGNQLSDAVNAATTKDQVDAIVDNRT